MLPYFHLHVRYNVMHGNEKLFVCGGWWNNRNLSTCCLYDFDNEEWSDLRDMNNSHQCPGICEWKQRGNKIIVGGGFPDNKDVEEYDMHKDKWVDLPNLNKKHHTYPAILSMDNLLICIGGVHTANHELGFVEFYDPRDSANKWFYVDTVEKYFDLRQDGGLGFNCILPF